MLENYPNLESPPFGTSFAQIFGPGCTEDPTTTMMQALWLDDTPPLPPDGSGGSSPVLAHSVAAYCNAHFFGKSTYGLSPDEVVELVVSMITTDPFRSEEHTSELQSLMRISYAVFCLKKKTTTTQ